MQDLMFALARLGVRAVRAFLRAALLFIVLV